MKRLIKTDEAQTGQSFQLDEKLLSPPQRVQGGVKRGYKNVLFVQSGGRYKLETQSIDYVKILAGSGHFKWARGETPFLEGEVFIAEGIGEYEINGNCSFTVIRK